MPHSDFQQAFLLQLISRMPATSDPETMIAARLNIDRHAAAQILANTATLSMQQLQHLAVHYRISLDQIIQPQTDAYLFHGRIPLTTEQVFETWLDDIYQQAAWFNTFSRRRITFLTKDLPFLSHLLLPELAAFKFFFWQKSILHYESLRGKKFSIADSAQYSHSTSQKILSSFNRIPTAEIWNEESINSTLKQISFYRTAGIFASDDDALQLYDKVNELLNHIEKQAARGLKFAYNAAPEATAAPYQLYVNNLVLGDNTLFAELDHMSITYLNHSVINYVSTADTAFNDYMNNVLQNLISKSVSLTDTAAREAFFHTLRQKVQQAAAGEINF